MKSQLLLGTFGAIVGGVIGAVVWAGVTAATNYQIGYMAIGVGFLAGAGMRILGGGRDPADGYVAGAVAFLGCVLGNILTPVIVIAQHQHVAIMPLIGAVLTKPAVAFELLRDGFSIMDVLFYGLAVYAGYRTARKAPEAALETAAQAEPSATPEPTTRP